MTRYTFLLILILSCSSSITFAKKNFSPEKTYVVKDGDWGVSLYEIDGKRPLINYTPTGYLLFDIDQSHEKFLGSRYVPTTTQDGVRIYFPVSKIINREKFGSVSVDSEDIMLMFHAEETICQDTGCTDKDIDPTFTVNPGRIFKLQKNNSPNYYNLIATYEKQDEQWGVISQTDLDRLIAQGIVTKLTQKHPRYFIDKVNASLADVYCPDSKKTSKNITKDMAGVEDQMILNFFQLGYINENKLVIDKPYGGDGTAYNHHLYRVYDNWEKRSFF